jgi:hypothetical protein
MTTTANDMGLTAAEFDMLKHRLDVPDAIVECLDDYHPSDVEDIIDCLGRGSLTDARSYSEAIAHAVLFDCVDGSTAVACYYERNNPTPEYRAAVRVGRSLARKVSRLIGKPVVIREM